MSLRHSSSLLIPPQLFRPLRLWLKFLLCVQGGLLFGQEGSDTRACLPPPPPTHAASRIHARVGDMHLFSLAHVLSSSLRVLGCRSCGGRVWISRPRALAPRQREEDCLDRPPVRFGHLASRRLSSFLRSLLSSSRHV